MNAAERNLTLYPMYLAAVSFFAWMPVFFLYFSSYVSFNQVLSLAAIYYASVVVLEVPSGYFSDRIGRRPTLVIAATALTLAYVTFSVSTSFAGFAVAQILLATGLAFNSGTDTSFHLANLQALGKTHEYGEREAKLGALVFAMGAAAALVGGALGSINLSFAYYASGVAAAFALCVALAFRGVAEDDVPSAGFTQNLAECVHVMHKPQMGWIFLVVVVATVLNHIPYEFYQPYLDALPSTPWPEVATPFVAGLHMAAVLLIAIPVARMSNQLSQRLNLVRYLLASLTFQVILITLMMLFLSPWIALLLVFRSIPRAMQDTPIRAAITPELSPHIRATYLSVQSLAGRLTFSLFLVILSVGPPDDLAATLQVCAAVASFMALVTYYLSRPRRSSNWRF